MTTLPDHGTLCRYVIHKCRCEPCRGASRTYALRVHRLKGYGQWQPFVDAQPVRDHLAMLGEYGLGWMRAAAIAGVPTGNISKILYGSRHPYRAPSRRVRPATAARILALQPSLDLLADNARTPATGTARRVQALMARGFTQTYLAQRTDSHHSNLRKILDGTHVTARRARQIIALYDELWDKDPTACGITPGAARYARNLAAARGWAPPAAWDDDTINDPTAQPDLGEPVSRQDALAEDAAFIARTTGVDLDRIAERLGVSRNYLDKVHERAMVGA